MVGGYFTNCAGEGRGGGGGMAHDFLHIAVVQNCSRNVVIDVSRPLTSLQHCGCAPFFSQVSQTRIVAVKMRW